MEFEKLVVGMVSFARIGLPFGCQCVDINSLGL